MSFSPRSKSRPQTENRRYIVILIPVLALLVSSCAQGPVGTSVEIKPLTMPRASQSSATAHYLAPAAQIATASASKSPHGSTTHVFAAKPVQSVARNDNAATKRSNGRVPSVFGSVQVRRNDIDAFVGVRSALDRTYLELDSAASCRPGYWRKCPVAEWKAFLGKLDGKDQKSQLRGVNRYVNRARYISDQRNYGVADLWATAGQLFERGGDCEDYVVAKYVSLRKLGVPADSMQMAVVYDRVRRIGHAVLLVAVGAETLVLDNQSPYVLPAERVTAYQAIYSVNENNWWVHQTTQRAAATRLATGNDDGQG